MAGQQRCYPQAISVASPVPEGAHAGTGSSEMLGTRETQVRSRNVPVAEAECVVACNLEHGS